MVFTIYADRHLRRCLFKSIQYAFGYEAALIHGHLTWDGSDLDRFGQFGELFFGLKKPSSQQVSDVALGRRASLVNSLESRGLKVIINGAYATISSIEVAHPGLLGICRRDPISRLGVLYSAVQIDNWQSVPIYHGTIFGELFDRASERLISEHTRSIRCAARLHRDIFIVGRADVSVRCGTPGVRRFEMVAARERLRPTLKKARFIAEEVSEYLADWESVVVKIYKERRERLLKNSTNWHEIDPEDAALLGSLRP